MIDLTGLDNFVELINSKIFNFISTVGQEIHAEVVRVLEENKKKVTGQLIDSIKWEVRKELESYLVEVYSTSPYAKHIYYGTSPHFPPVQKIAEWVLAKGIVPPEEVKSVAFMIARSISQKGSAGLKFFDIALDRYRPILMQRVTEAGLKLV